MNKKLLWLLTLLSLAAVTFAEAQRAGKVYRIGVLEVISTARNAANFDAFPTRSAGTRIRTNL